MQGKAASDAVEQLRAVANRFGEGWRQRKTTLLRSCTKLSFDDPKVVLPYHDVLLFLLAYHEDRALCAQAKAELQRVAEIARTFNERGGRYRKALLDTGIAWSQTTYAYSYQIARWLARDHPDHAELDDARDDAEPLKRLLRLCLPPMEYELVGEHDLTATALLDEAKGESRQSRLAWLVTQVERLACDDRTKEHLFDTLEPYVTLAPKDGVLSRTFARGLEVPPFFHARGLQREFDIQKVIATRLPSRRRLSREDRRRLIDTARGVLAVVGRETDVITLAMEAGMESFDLDRGISIALYAMPPERRFPLDTHVGMMVFKNCMPVAYGGGWPFLGTCKIGVNVFPAFRGGESSYLFAQVLRVYAQRFKAERFLVEPYQIGEGNPEGVRSGAFWFYYRLGFRPLATRHAALAHSEFQRLSTDRNYRSPLAVMRRLSHADMELRVASNKSSRVAWADPALLSNAVSAWIERQFEGDRAQAQRAARRRVADALGIRSLDRWTKPERHAVDSLSLVLAMIPDLAKWSSADRRACVAVIRAKGHVDESEFARRSTAHRRLREALLRIVH